MHSYHKHHRSSRQLRRTATPRFFYFCCSLVLMFAGVFAFFWLRGAPADALASATPSPTFSASAVQTPVPTAATPTPLPTHTPKASATQAPAGDRKDDAFFHNAVFIGNSQVEGLALFSGLKDTTYYASKGLTVDTIFTKPVVAQADGTSITIMQALGLCTFFIGIGGAVAGLVTIEDGALSTQHTMLLVLSLVIGALVGEIINLEHLFERFGEWLKNRTGNARDKKFVEDFVNASLTVCIGAMAVVGSIQDGIYGDYSVLATKAVLDLIIILVMTCSAGAGCVFSAVPVAVFEGVMTALASLLKPVMTEAALANLSLVGSILIFCVGLNLVWGRKIRVANLLPALVFAVAAAFLPFSL